MSIRAILTGNANTQAEFLLIFRYGIVASKYYTYSHAQLCMSQALVQNRVEIILTTPMPWQ